MNEAIDPENKNRYICMRHPVLTEQELDYLERSKLEEIVRKDVFLYHCYYMYNQSEITWNEMLIMMVTGLYQHKEEICKKLEELYINTPLRILMEDKK